MIILLDSAILQACAALVFVCPDGSQMFVIWVVSSLQWGSSLVNPRRGEASSAGILPEFSRVCVSWCYHHRGSYF